MEEITIMYTHSTAKQLAHLTRKIDKGIVSQFSDANLHPNMMEYYKAHMPWLTAPRSSQDLWEEMGFTWSTTTRKADVVVAGTYLENTMDIVPRLKEIYARGKVNSYIVIACTTGLNQGYLSIQPNFWLQIAQDNDVEIPYMSICDGRSQHHVFVDSSKKFYKHSMLADLTHKFVECREMITNITIKKLSTKELVCPQ